LRVPGGHKLRAAIQRIDQAGISGLPRRCAPRNDELLSASWRTQGKTDMQFIDRIPLPLLVLLTLFMLGAPFVPEPHLVEKMRMLSQGTLTRFIDIFDVLWHLLPAALLGVRIARMRKKA
jgi:hypothetical protein